jgi:hypothetical protein
MTQDWRIPITFEDSWNQSQKRMMRQERRPAVTSASQILGPGAAPFAVQLEDWNEEGATFTGVFYSEPNAANSPDEEGGLPGDYYWMGETFGYTNEDGERWGYQRVTRIRVATDTAGAPPSGWVEYRRRFFAQGEQVAYTLWDLL